MTKDDNKNLFLFATRLDMYVYPVDDKNIVSFINGYELGTQHKCDFTLLLKQLISDKYQITYSSDGWPGQITRLSETLALNWVTTFKKIALEIVADEAQNVSIRESDSILTTQMKN